MMRDVADEAHHDRAAVTEEVLLTKVLARSRDRCRVTHSSFATMLADLVDAEVPSIDEFAPSTRFIELPGSERDDRAAFNPSIAADPDGGYRCIVRHANYRYVEGRYETLDGSDAIVTENALLTLDGGLQVTARHPVDDRLALARRYPPDEARADRYDALQTAARDAGIGLWSPTACGPGDGSGTTEVSIRMVLRDDAAGDDSQNLNDEWVRFVNEGNEPLDLDGWQVADESASHRYRSRDLVLEPGGQVTVHTGCGTDTADRRFRCNTGSAVWNNSGDTVFLWDPDGNNVVTYPYSRGHPNAS